MELKLTIALREFASNAGSASRTTRNVPVRLMPTIRFHSSRLVSCVCAARRMPAALTSESRPSSVWTAQHTLSITESSSPTSIVTVVRRSAVAASSARARVVARPSSATSEATTVAPSSSNRSAVAWPIPDAAPVTRIRLPSSRFICRSRH